MTMISAKKTLLEILKHLMFDSYKTIHKIVIDNSTKLEERIINYFPNKDIKKLIELVINL